MLFVHSIKGLFLVIFAQILISKTAPPCSDGYTGPYCIKFVHEIQGICEGAHACRIFNGRLAIKEAALLIKTDDYTYVGGSDLFIERYGNTSGYLWSDGSLVDKNINWRRGYPVDADGLNCLTTWHRAIFNKDCYEFRSVACEQVPTTDAYVQTNFVYGGYPRVNYQKNFYSCTETFTMEINECISK